MNEHVRPVNILHIISTLNVGGVENQLVIILGKYDRRKLFPLVCSLSDKGEIGREIEESGIEVIPLKKLGHQFNWTIVRDIYKLIKTRDVKIVRTHQYHANLYGRLAAWLAKVPCIVASVHNVYTRDRKLHRRIINKFLSGFTDKVVAVSETVKRDILRYDGLMDDKVTVIYNGIDTQRFSDINGNSVRASLGIPLETPVIGTVGRLTIQKGQKYLIDAVAMLREKFPQILLLIVGDGPVRDDLQNHIKAIGIDKNAIFLGTRRDIPQLLSAMDIFVLPSLWEGLGTALIEAMASGKAVIATDIAPFREVINSEKVGILVPVKDRRAIASSVELLLNNKALARTLGRCAKERSFSNFSMDITTNRYVGLFENILSGKGWNI
jgi:glycosyltransferase involved in cell wall biosynthesis